MRIFKDPGRLNAVLSALKKRHKDIALVPTMGALHAGHLSLIRRARHAHQIVAVSIFVNPSQFGPREDFRRYPRTLQEDIALCRAEKVDFLFIPAVKEVYPPGYRTFVEVEGLSKALCGKSRPGHFRGVTTIVAKLFNITVPDAAYFGGKDAQQAVIIERMARDLNFPVKIKVLPVVREKGGLAFSSRNRYLKQNEREDALVLYQALQQAAGLINRGVRKAGLIEKHIRRSIKAKKSARIDYVSIVAGRSLQPVKILKGECLIALAVRFGNTRLIDNLTIKV